MTKVKRWSDSSDLICTMYSQFHQPTCCSNLSRQCVDTDFSKWNLFATCHDSETHILLIPSTQSYFLSYVTFPRFLTHPFKSLPLNNMWNYFTVALPTISIGLREERPIISTYGCNITQFDQNQILVSTFRIHSCLLNVSIVEFYGEANFFYRLPSFRFWIFISITRSSTSSPWACQSSMTFSPSSKASSMTSSSFLAIRATLMPIL